MPYGSVTYINETTYIGSQILYSCVRNYRLTGVSYRECQENKQWSGESSRCEEIRCPEPTLTDHSILSVTGNDRVYGRTLIRTADSAASVTTYKIGALAKYRCERGYKIVGEPLSTCEDTGRWSGEMPQCACEYNCHTPNTYIDTSVNYQQQGNVLFTTKNSITKNVNDAHLRTRELAVGDPTNYNVRVNTNNLMNYQIQEVKSHFPDNNIISSPINRHKFGIEKPVIRVPVNYLWPEARPWGGNMAAHIHDTYPLINEIQNFKPNSQPYSRHKIEQPLHTHNKQSYKNKLKETNKGKYDKTNSQAHKHNFIDTHTSHYNNHDENYLPDIPNNFHVKLLRNEELKLRHGMPPKLFMNNFFISNSQYEPFVRTIIPHEKGCKTISKQNIMLSKLYTDKGTRKPSENIPKLPVNINKAPLRLEKPTVNHRVPLDNYLVPPGSLLAPLTKLYEPPEDVPNNKPLQAVQTHGPEPSSKEVHTNIEHGHVLDDCWKFHNGFIVYVDCGMPEPLAHGHFTLASNATYYGVVVLYDCDPNFELDGHGRRLCMENGTWSSDTPVCKEITCGNLQTEGTMSVQVMTHSVGGVAHYSCPKGQYMVGNSTRVCTKKGTWTGHTPECKFFSSSSSSKRRQRVEDITKAMSSLPVAMLATKGNVQNTTVFPHYERIGPYLRKCMDDGTWSGEEPRCERKPLFFPHYERIGPYLRKCMDDGTWSGEEPRCEMTTNEVSEPQSLGMTIGIAAGVVVFLMFILGLIYLRLIVNKYACKPNRKEDQNAAVMSYANLNDSNGYGMPPNHPNIYENIHDNDHTYDAPYEETRHHYEASPVSRTASGPVVTINGVAVR
ncbi:unnamed protein product [Timema podura]|uniref:Sushi domain-containing protein n=1 Tax=Timema podura TaxID=61482 RepID=A0ABN7NLP5_TIMPD|nr:unnamed protein product [Timema podura]